MRNQSLFALAVLMFIMAALCQIGPSGYHPGLFSAPYCFLGLLAASVGALLRDTNRRIAELENRLKERDRG